MSPRWSLALLSGLVALVLGWAAVVLPWRSFTIFAVVTMVVAVLHGATCALALAGHRLRSVAWRIQSVAAVVFLAYMTWNMVASAAYVARLYGGLGRGLAVGMAVVWTVPALLLIPSAIWGIAATGGIRGRRVRIGGAAIVLIAASGLWRSSARAEAVPLAEPDAGVFAALDGLDLPSGRGNLALRKAIECGAPPTEVGATAIAVFRAPKPGSKGKGRGPTVVVSRCVQADTPAQAVEGVATALREAGAMYPVKVDLLRGAQPLRSVAPGVDALFFRPGLDGVCRGQRCLMPWQLVLRNDFVTHKPFPFIDDLRFGVDPVGIHRDLGAEKPFPTTLDGLHRIEVDSQVLRSADDRGALRRMRSDGPELTDAAVNHAARGAEAHILNAQGQDGRFRYKVNPFTGRESFRGFSVPRQAGTTFALCDIGEEGPARRKVVQESLRMLAGIERRRGDLGTLWYPASKKVRRTTLGPTALSLVAFATCRSLVGDEFDPVMGRLARFLLTMQRPDGGYYPRFDLGNEAPVPGPDPLYAGGQAVLALTLLERATREGPIEGWPSHQSLRDAVDRSMDYFAQEYWSGFVSNFFYIEENWHCLAARAALSHHRHDGYERFCLDYVGFKRRLILDGESRVDRDLLGGYGFGNVLLPHNTGTSGFTEALAAATDVMRAREMDTSEEEALLRLTLGFLLHHQWRKSDCFACTKKVSIPGSFSEHMGSPTVRIDYVQHALSALRHGGRLLWREDAPIPGATPAQSAG